MNTNLCLFRPSEGENFPVFLWLCWAHVEAQRGTAVALSHVQILQIELEERFNLVYSCEEIRMYANGFVTFHTTFLLLYVVIRT
jgi:hypothetical protein